MDSNNTQYNNQNSRVNIEHQKELASMFDEPQLVNNNETKNNKERSYGKNSWFLEWNEKVS